MRWLMKIYWMHRRIVFFNWARRTEKWHRKNFLSIVILSIFKQIMRKYILLIRHWLNGMRSPFRKLNTYVSENVQCTGDKPFEHNVCLAFNLFSLFSLCCLSFCLINVFKWMQTRSFPRFYFDKSLNYNNIIPDGLSFHLTHAWAAAAAAHCQADIWSRKWDIRLRWNGKCSQNQCRVENSYFSGLNDYTRFVSKCWKRKFSMLLSSVPSLVVSFAFRMKRII